MAYQQLIKFNSVAHNFFMGEHMSLKDDILSVLTSEGYLTNEVILDALADFIGVVEDEMESHDSDSDLDDDDD